MMKRRHVLAGFAATAAAAGLTACGGSGGSSSSGGSDGSGSDAGGGPVELTYMHRLPDGEGMVPVADIVARWNEEHPDIQVTATKFDGDASEMIVRLENDVTAGTAPDLAQVGYAEVPSLFTKGLLLDVATEAGNYEGDFAPGAFSLMRVGEAVVGLPQDTGPLVYYYNATEFEKLGLSVPTTSAELLEVAQAAAEKDKLALSFQSDEAWYGLAGQAAAAGAVWYKAENDSWVVEVDSPETAKVAEFWQSALDADAALTEQRWSDGFTAALIDQKLIGTIGAAWEAALLADSMADSPNAGQWKVAQLPAFGDAPMSGPDGGSGVAVLKGCEHTAQAMEFNAWFNSQVADLASQGLVVASTESVETPEALAEFFSGQDVMAELATANEAMNEEFMYMPTWPALQDPMVRAAAAAADGSGKVADVFTAAQETSVSSLEDAGLPVAD